MTCIRNGALSGAAMMIVGLGLGLAPAKPAAAQSAACVNLLVGAGYAAWMGVKLGDSIYWSDSFPIGQHRCVALPVKGMVNGSPYSVVVSAVLGSSKVPCTPDPSPYSSSNTASVVYNAWGTTLNVHCEMPSAAAMGTAAKPDPDAMAKPSAEGLKALETWKSEGPKPAPN